MNKYKIGYILLLITSCLIISGCKSKEEKTVEITLIHGWGSTEKDHVAMRNIYKDFELENSDVKLNMISMPSRDEMIRKVEDMILVGKVPDVIFLGGIGQNVIYDFMVENDLALDIMPYIEKVQGFKDSVAPSNLDYWTTNENQIFTISDVLVLSGGYWYNEEIFKQAEIKKLPETWTEFIKVCDIIDIWAKKNNQDVKPLQTLAEGYLYFTDHMAASSEKYGPSIIEDKRMYMDSISMIMILQQLEKIYSFTINHDENYSYRDETDLFNEGKLAMYVNGVWGASMISSTLPAKYALLPSGENNSVACESTNMGYMLGNSQDEIRKDASIRFLKYMLSESVQERILLETEQMPANNNIHIEDFKERMPRFYQAVTTVQASKTKIETPGNLWDEDQMSFFSDNILDVLRGLISKENFVLSFQ